MKRQSSLALCAVFLLSACKAPGVISGGEYNASDAAAAVSKPAATNTANAIESNSPVATTYAVQDTPTKTNKPLEVSTPTAQVAPAPMAAPAPTAEVASPGISTALPKEVPQLAQVSAAPSVPAKIEKVPFRLGVSSVTVERLAKQNQCESKTGAGLLARNGPIEVYRVDCNDGKVYMARCEMRQCSSMTNTQ